MVAASPANVTWLLKHMGRRSIGPDKVNQLRHARFLKDQAGLDSLMKAHRKILEPKFGRVRELFSELLSGTGAATWTEPTGGYFISLDVLDGTAARVIALAKQAGVALTQAGSSFPYGDDPNDRNIRLAPTFPEPAEVEIATRAVATCARLAAAEKLVG